MIPQSEGPTKHVGDTNTKMDTMSGPSYTMGDSPMTVSPKNNRDAITVRQ
jgi:hypothetical protein